MYAAQAEATTGRIALAEGVVSAANNAPTVANRIPHQNLVVGTAFSYTFPANTFNDADGDTLTYTSRQTDGTALPSWLTFTASTRTFSGTPPAGTVPVINVLVVASDGIATAQTWFNLSVKAGNSAPTVAKPIPRRTAEMLTPFSYTFPANTFNDADGDTLTYTAARPPFTFSGRALPSWLTFDRRHPHLLGHADDDRLQTVRVDRGDRERRHRLGEQQIQNRHRVYASGSSSRQRHWRLRFGLPARADGLCRARSRARRDHRALEAQRHRSGRGDMDHLVAKIRIRLQFSKQGRHLRQHAQLHHQQPGPGCRVRPTADRERRGDGQNRQMGSSRQRHHAGAQHRGANRECDGVRPAHHGQAQREPHKQPLPLPRCVVHNVEGRALHTRPLEAGDQDLQTPNHELRGSPDHLSLAARVRLGRLGPDAGRGQGHAELRQEQGGYKFEGANFGDELEVGGAEVGNFDDMVVTNLAPHPTGATVNGNVMTVTFDQALDESRVPRPGSFQVSAPGYRHRVGVTEVSISGSTVTLTLSEGIPSHATRVWAHYYPGGPRLSNADGYGVRCAFYVDAEDVTVITPNTAPYVEYMSVGHSTRPEDRHGIWREQPPGPRYSSLAVKFNEPMDAEIPPSSAFTVTAHPRDGGRAVGDTIRVQVTFDGPVDVTGTPRLKIDLDPAYWGEKWAAYEEGSGTGSLTFVHEVVEPNVSTEGIAVLANTLALNGGTIRGGDADADLAHDGLGHDAAHKVDWQAEPEGSGLIGSSGPPTVTGVSVVSGPGDDATYGLGDRIRVAVRFGAAVTVDTTGGTPALAIDLDPAYWGEKWAAYEEGSGTSSLTFVHEVVEPNLSTEGIAVLADTLALNGGTIKSVATQEDAALAHGGLAHDADHKVDWRLAPAPALTASFHDVPSSHGGEDSTFSFGLVFSEALVRQLSSATLRTEALSATNATVVRTKRVVMRDSSDAMRLNVTRLMVCSLVPESGAPIPAKPGLLPAPRDERAAQSAGARPGRQRARSRLHKERGADAWRRRLPEAEGGRSTRMGCPGRIPGRRPAPGRRRSRAPSPAAPRSGRRCRWPRSACPGIGPCDPARPGSRSRSGRRPRRASTSAGSGACPRRGPAGPSSRCAPACR